MDVVVKVVAATPLDVATPVAAMVTGAQPTQTTLQPPPIMLATMEATFAVRRTTSPATTLIVIRFVHFLLSMALELPMLIPTRMSPITKCLNYWLCISSNRQLSSLPKLPIALLPMSRYLWAKGYNTSHGMSSIARDAAAHRRSC